MVSTSKTILRAILILSYIAITVLIVFGISTIFSYLNTGADRSKMLHTNLKKIDQYLPKIIWSPLNNDGRPMDAQTLNALENDYMNAWYVRHLCYLTNTTEGLDDYYTESTRENLFNIINLNKLENITVDETTLKHHLTLEFFSEDGQLIVLTDTNVIEYKAIYQKNNLILETTEVSDYKIVLLFEDGFWRIRHLVKQNSKNYHHNNRTLHLSTLNIKGINYYPQNTPWDMFGNSFDIHAISKDFQIIAKSGLNSIRIFVPYEDFGKAHVNTQKLNKLKQVIDTAENNQLKVVVTLFDFYGDYSVLDWTLNQRFVETIVTAFKNHNAIMAWDIKNEPNLDFESRGKTKVTAWLKHMIHLVKSIDNTHPVTIGWSEAESADILKGEVDFISFHYYQNIQYLEKTFTQLKNKIPNKPVVITEFGSSSYSGFWNLFNGSEEKQTRYHQTAQQMFSKHNIPYMSWTLYDFTEIPEEVVGRLPWRKRTQEYYGFINQNGESKPAFKYISKE